MNCRQVCFPYWCAKLIVVWLVMQAAANAKTVPDIPRVVTHDNLEAAGKLEGGALTLRLEIREAEWHPDAEGGPSMPILAFAEEGKSPSVPGPMIRVQQGTSIHVSVKNTTLFPAWVHGLHARPGVASDVLKIPPEGTQEATFLAGEPGTYYYWAATGFDISIDARLTWDTQLSGAFVVDAPGEHNNDRVMVIGLWYSWLVPFDFTRGFYQIPTVNGKSWPHTTRLSYDMGETIHWRIINASVSIHPMHLHGAYFQVDSAGDGERDTNFPSDERRSVVTERMAEGHTMTVSWKPSHSGNWIFHCHLADHFSANIAHAVSDVMGAHPEESKHSEHDSGMAGLVVGIQVKPLATEIAAVSPAPAVRKLELVVSRSAGTGSSRRRIEMALREGSNVSSTVPGVELGPTIVLHRGETTEITVMNQLASPTAIHWHGIELESYYDGVVALGGDARQVTPSIEPGGLFVARMTPPRAGTFIYHTHWHDMDQLTSGLYGPLIVLEPGEKYDAEHDRVFLVSRGGADLFYDPMLVNGTEHPGVSELRAGSRYRFRLINITPSDDATDMILVSGGKPVIWTPRAKDGADLPAHYRKPCEAKVQFGAGETYDFEFSPENAGKLELKTTFVNLHTNLPITVVDANDSVASRR